MRDDAVLLQLTDFEAQLERVEATRMALRERVQGCARIEPGLLQLRGVKPRIDQR